MAAPSVFILIAKALQSLLLAAPRLAAGRVWRDRLSPLIQENQQAINIRLDKTFGGSGGVTGAPTDWATEFLVECYARGTADTLPTEVVDSLLVAVWERLSEASTNPALLALAVQDVLPDPEIEWDLGTGESPQVTALVTVRVIHRTKPGQLVPWPA